MSEKNETAYGILSEEIRDEIPDYVDGYSLEMALDYDEDVKLLQYSIEVRDEFSEFYDDFDGLKGNIDMGGVVEPPIYTAFILREVVDDIFSEWEISYGNGL